MEFLVGGAGCWSLGWRFMGGMVVRVCVRGFSLSLRWWVLEMSSVCILGSWRRECQVVYLFVLSGT